MSLVEMRDFVKTSKQKDRTYYKTLMDYHKKFSIPLASVVLGLIAVPLGIQSDARKRSSGLAFGLVFFLIYYILLTIGTEFREIGESFRLISVYGCPM